MEKAIILPVNHNNETLDVSSPAERVDFVPAAILMAQGPMGACA
jgi:hypothetical protein